MHNDADVMMHTKHMLYEGRALRLPQSENRIKEEFLCMI